MKSHLKVIFSSNKIIIFLLCFIACSHAVSNTIDISKRNRPVMEEFNFIERANAYYDIFKHPAKDSLQQALKLQYSTQYSVYPLSASLLLLIFGNQDPYFWLRFIQSFYLCLFIIFFYKLGKLLFNRSTALLAVVVCTFGYFNFNHYSRVALADLPMTAMITLSVYLLLKSNNFRNRKYAVLFGLFFGLTLMTKFQAIGILFFPVLMVALNLTFPRLQLSSPVRLPGQAEKGLPWKNILISLAFFSAVYLFFMFYDLNIFRHWLRKEVLDTAYSVGPQGRLNWEATLYYLRWGIYDYLTVFLVLPFIVGIFWSLTKKRKRTAVLNFWFWGSYLFFTYVVGDKEPRYALPFLPAFALLSVFWVSLLKEQSIRRTIITLLAILSLVFYLGSVWRVRPFNKNHLTIKGVILTPPVVPSAKAYNTNARKLLKILEENSPQEKLKVLEMFRTAVSEGAGELVYLRGFTPYKRKVERWDIIDDVPATDPTQPSGYRWKINLEAFLKDDFILAKTGEVISERQDKGQMRVMYEAYKLLDKLLTLPNPPYKLLDKVYIPLDNSFFLIYQKTHPLSIDEVMMLTKEAIRLWPEDRVRYINILQSYLIERIIDSYPGRVSEQLSKHLYQEHSYPDNDQIKLWSKEELVRLLSDVPNHLQEKKLLLSIDNKFR